MGPIRYKAPLPVRWLVERGAPTKSRAPENLMGKSLITLGPCTIKDRTLEKIRKLLRTNLGKNEDFNIPIHATKSRTMLPAETRKGCGRGKIKYFVAQVPAGSVIAHIPKFGEGHDIVTNFALFRKISHLLPTASTFRDNTPIRLERPKISGTVFTDQYLCKVDNFKPNNKSAGLPWMQN